MEFIIDKDNILDNAAAYYISKEAANVHGEDGTSLYDALQAYSSDAKGLGDFLEGAVAALLARIGEIASRRRKDNGQDVLFFYVPDFDMNREPTAAKQIEDYLALSVAASWFTHKGDKELSDKMTAMAATALEKANTILKTRAPILRFQYDPVNS